jgi:hypothetical protein
MFKNIFLIFAIALILIAPIVSAVSNETLRQQNNEYIAKEKQGWIEPQTQEQSSQIDTELFLFYGFGILIFIGIVIIILSRLNRGGGNYL